MAVLKTRRQRALATAGGAGLAVGVAHYGAHNVFGNAGSFDRAGVTEAGAVSALTAAGVVAALNRDDILQ